MGGYKQAKASPALLHISLHIRLRILVASVRCLSKPAERLPSTVALLLLFRWFPVSLEFAWQSFALSRT